MSTRLKPITSTLGVAVLILAAMSTIAAARSGPAPRTRLQPKPVAAAAAPLAQAGSQCNAVFEIDGDSVDTAPVGSLPQDFNTLNPTPSAGNLAKRSSFIVDPPNATIYTTGGSKDDLDINQWRYTNGSVPDKDEILNAYAALYQAPNGNNVLVFGGDRFAVNGSSNIGFWFFKNQISLNSDGTFSGVHTDGDLLLLSAFTNGGGVSVIKVFEWVGADGSPCSGTLVNGVLCDVTATALGTAITNNATIQLGWTYVPKGGPIPGQPANSAAKGAYFEGCLDLTASGISDACFASFLLETRSSPAVDATLKDFVLGSFETCGIEVTKTATPTEACEGTPVDYHYTVTNIGLTTLTVNLVDDNETPSDTSDDIDVDGGSGVSVVGGGGTATFDRNGVVLAAGTHTNTVTATGTAGTSTVSDTASATVTINPNPTCSVSRSPVSGSVCAGGAASLTCNPSGGTAPYSFSWSGPGGFTATTQTIAFNPAVVGNTGTYTVTVTDSKGCTTTCSGSIVVNPNPSCSISPPDASICTGSDQTFTVTPTGGTAPYTISWTGPNGFTAGNVTSITLTNVSLSDAGTYTALVVDAAGCMTECTATLSISPNPVVNITAADGCVFPEITLTAEIEGNPDPANYTFAWTGPDGFTASTQSINVSRSGVFSVNVALKSMTACNDDATATVGVCLKESSTKMQAPARERPKALPKARPRANRRAP